MPSYRSMRTSGEGRQIEELEQRGSVTKYLRGIRPRREVEKDFTRQELERGIGALK